jgi:hypothetical protein
VDHSYEYDGSHPYDKSELNNEGHFADYENAEYDYTGTYKEDIDDIAHTTSSQDWKSDLQGDTVRDPGTVFGYDKQTGEVVEFETNDPELFAEYAQALEDVTASAESLGQTASESMAASAGAHTVSEHYQSHEH